MAKYKHRQEYHNNYKNKYIKKYDSYKESSNYSRSNNYKNIQPYKKYYEQKMHRRSYDSHSPTPSSSSSPSYSSKSSSSDSFSKNSSPSKSSISSVSSAAQRHRVEHYSFERNEKLGGKYKIKKHLGDGTFGRVVECKYEGKVYAVKIIKPVQKYIHSAKIERSILKRINDKDKDDQFGIVRYIQSFYHKEHFCMVFKPLGKSLYDFLKMNDFRGFPLPLVQSFFRQILKSIGFLHRNGYTHTDLKPENILLQNPAYIESSPDIPFRAPDSSARYYHPLQKRQYYLPLSDTVKIIDFGGATKHDDYHSSIINTRQYRSPEVILQCCKWSEISDVWSIGCIICELYSGELLFPAYDDEEHLAMIEKNSGKYPSWMLNRIPSSHPERKLFLDGYINQDRLEHIENIIGMRIIEDIFPEQRQLVHLLHLCLQIDPNKRITCAQALHHPFFSLKFRSN